MILKHLLVKRVNMIIRTNLHHLHDVVDDSDFTINDVATKYLT